MNENTTVIEGTTTEMIEVKKESWLKRKKHEIGQKLANDEPLISKEMKITIGVVGTILTGAAIGIAKFMSGGDASDLDGIQEGEWIDLDEVADAADSVTNTVE